MLASVAQFGARPTGDQEVAGLTLAGSAHSVVEIDHEMLSMVILSLTLIHSRRAVVSFWQKNVHNSG